MTGVRLLRIVGWSCIALAVVPLLVTIAQAVWFGMNGVGVRLTWVEAFIALIRLVGGCAVGAVLLALASITRDVRIIREIAADAERYD